jgi:alpha-beta hydrolase superfamily lysophospholipase
VLLGAVVAAVVFFLASALRGPRPQPWHTWAPHGELTAASAEELAGLDDYLALEDRLFAELARERQTWPVARQPLSRFHAGGILAPGGPGGDGRDWNRTFELAPAASAPRRGAALLLHGLSDSPYSLRAVGGVLADQGYRVVGLRLPGHGLAPGALRGVSWRDWTAAVRLAARSVAGSEAPHARSDDTAPELVLVGYSNGAALALDYTLEALDDPALPVPTRLVLLSPAFAVTRLAALARWQRRLAALPGLDRLGWTDLVPEYDPYKYNSFPVAAGEQLHLLIGDLDARLEALAAAGRADEAPPVLTFQSVVDATVPPEPSLRRLLGPLGGPGDEVVLFDLDRSSDAALFLAPGTGALADLAVDGGPYPFAVTLVTNTGATKTGPSSRRVEARTRAAGASVFTVEPLELAWPRGVYSLSHVALPFPPDDPLYGLFPPPGRGVSLGSLAARGERGVLRVPASLLQRLRCNVFFPYLEERLVAFVTARPAAAARDPAPPPVRTPAPHPPPAAPGAPAAAPG